DARHRTWSRVRLRRRLDRLGPYAHGGRFHILWAPATGDPGNGDPRHRSNQHDVRGGDLPIRGFRAIDTWRGPKREGPRVRGGEPRPWRVLAAGSPTVHPAEHQRPAYRVGLAPVGRSDTRRSVAQLPRSWCLAANTVVGIDGERRS